MTQAQTIDTNYFHTTLESVLNEVCQATDWLMGEAWVPNPQRSVLECSPACYISPKISTYSVERFRLLSEKLTFNPGVGLPGRVWSSKKPEWDVDVSMLPQTTYIRNQLAQEAGLRAGLGTPIIVNGEVLAVLVFYMTKSCEQDERMIKLISFFLSLSYHQPHAVQSAVN
ncbi:MAG: GAF domain-containing protein [Gemmatimonadaceae bacterium]|nr:GAF domain-containing protein [Gloeobacterales cyanobacterium ES-bin-141]